MFEFNWRKLMLENDRNGIVEIIIEREAVTKKKIG